MITQEEFTIENYNYQFRFAKMNAIEVLALETQMDFKNVKQSQATIEAILEKIEVKVIDTWVPVKMKDMNVYTPDEIEASGTLVMKLVNKFTKGLLEVVFPKSEE